jgi:hypothetical protein
MGNAVAAAGGAILDTVVWGFTSTWFWVVSIGFGVGVVELVSRYRESPLQALMTMPAVSYVLLNVIACASCLAILKIVRPSWIFQEGTTPEAQQLYLILAAGFGAVALFRSSIFKLKSADGDLSVGPSIILDTLLSASDRGVDRLLAAPRSERVAKLMASVSFDRAKAALPAYCFALMQNVGLPEQKTFADQVNSLSAAQMADKIRALSLGLALVNLVGDKVLARAVDDLKNFINDDPPVEEQVMAKTAELMGIIDFDKAKLILPIYCFSLVSSVSEESRTALARQIETVAASNLPARVRTLTLGLGLSQIVGFEVLKFCVDQLGNDIRIGGAPP